MANIDKITFGWVTQTWDENGNFVGQNFFAGDQVEYEIEGDGINVHDEPYGIDLTKLYQPFDMVQGGTNEN